MGDAGGLGPLPVRLEARVLVAALVALIPANLTPLLATAFPNQYRPGTWTRRCRGSGSLLAWSSPEETSPRRQVDFQRAAAAATRDKRGHRKRHTANGPVNQPLKPRQHSPCPPPYLRAPAKISVASAQRAYSSDSIAIAVMLRYQPRPRGSRGSWSVANASNSRLPSLRTAFRRSYNISRSYYKSKFYPFGASRGNVRCFAHHGRIGPGHGHHVRGERSSTCTNQKVTPHEAESPASSRRASMARDNSKRFEGGPTFPLE